MLYLCYDTALNEEYTLIKLIQKYPDYISLFKGTDDEDIWDAAPYLFEVHDNFYELRNDWLIQLDHCILFETNETKEEVCRFLQYYMYKNIGEKTFYTRIWDARVLISHLPGWQEQERVKFFTFFNAVYTEQTDREWLDKWQLGRWSKPLAATILKSDVLSPFVVADKSSVESHVILNTSSDVKAEDHRIEPVKAGENQLQKKRRFFID